MSVTSRTAYEISDKYLSSTTSPDSNFNNSAYNPVLMAPSTCWILSSIKIVSSFVTDVIMPPIGLLVGGVDFSNIKIVLKQAVGEVPAVTLNIGTFINTVIDFLIIAFAIFMMIKAMNNLKKKEEEPAPAPAAPEPSAEEKLLTEIRDLLKKQ